MQETFGDESPVLLIKNRNRKLGNSFTIENLPQLRERFPNLCEVIEVDLDKVPVESSWHDLLHYIRDYLIQLPHIGQPRPSTWVAVRKAIRRKRNPIMPWADFVKLCRKEGMTQDDDIQQVGDYLHNLGDILYFHADALLRDYVIVKPTWGLAAVYKVLDNPAVIDALGKFTWSDLRSLWHAPTYANHHPTLLRLMETFQLCYPLPDQSDTFIAPQLLTTDVPEYTWDRTENLQLCYYYPLFMPRGILSRAIVKLHHRIEEQRLVWRSGVILRDDYARAELLELRGDQQIRVRVSGRNKRDLLMEIVRALDDLHRGFPKLRYERQIPCNCESCRERTTPHFYDLVHLQERLAHRKETIECHYPPYNDVPIRGMVSEVDPWLDRPFGRGDRHYYIDRYIDSGGGAIIGGDVDVDGDFMGRDQHGNR